MSEILAQVRDHHGGQGKCLSAMDPYCARIVAARTTIGGEEKEAVPWPYGS